MMTRDGHCAQCGLHTAMKDTDLRVGGPCPDLFCPTYHRKEWRDWYRANGPLVFSFGPLDWAKLRVWVEPFKLKMQKDQASHYSE